jgi:hypothetical protein
LFNDASLNFNESTVTATKSTSWGYANDEAFTFSSEAQFTQCFNRLFDSANSVYYEALVTATESSVFGYSVGENNYLLKAEAASSFLRLYPEGSATYSEVLQDALTSSVYGYAGNETVNFKVAADNSGTGTSFLRVWGLGSNVFATVATEQDESFVSGYAGNSTENYSLSANHGTGKVDLQLWHSSGPTASLWADASTAGMKVENPDGDYCFADLGKLWVAYADGSNAQLFGGGAYLEGSDGTYIDVSTAAANGHNMYIQEMEVCGGQKIMVLCSDPY